MIILRVLVVLAALLLIGIVMWDVFETVVLPRSISRQWRLTRQYTRNTWRIWSALARNVRSSTRREFSLAVYGPVALLGLLIFWVALLIVAYAVLLWGLGSPLSTAHGSADFGADLYFSGTTFLTLGLGDVLPATSSARLITVLEVGTGFGLLALVIGYLPVLYQAFSRREMQISLLDAHAGSPPTAGALLRRHPPDRRAQRLAGILADWERWSAELLESHLSYPLLCYYRSQHENQSWVAGLTMILDACALVLACERGLDLDATLSEQAAFTFAMARHSAVDLARVFRAEVPARDVLDRRLPAAERVGLHNLLAEIGVATKSGEGKVEGRLDQFRALYEPYVGGLAAYLLMPLPTWVPPSDGLDDWQTTADGMTAPSISELASHRFSSRIGS